MPEYQLHETRLYGSIGPELPPLWLRYRDAFAVLQYMFMLRGGEPDAGVPWAKVVAALGFTRDQDEALLSYLVASDCVRYHHGHREAGLTARALEYLDTKRGRRRSVRPAVGRS